MSVQESWITSLERQMYRSFRKLLEAFDIRFFDNDDFSNYSANWMYLALALNE